MFLTTKTIRVPKDCEWHGEQWHDLNFVRYNASSHKVVIRTRCKICEEQKFDGWNYYEAVPFTFLRLLVELKQNNFESEN